MALNAVEHLNARFKNRHQTIRYLENYYFDDLRGILDLSDGKLTITAICYYYSAFIF